jgi:hypothetical protein
MLAYFRKQSSAWRENKMPTTTSSCMTFIPLGFLVRTMIIRSSMCMLRLDLKQEKIPCGYYQTYEGDTWAYRERHGLGEIGQSPNNSQIQRISTFPWEEKRVTRPTNRSCLVCTNQTRLLFEDRDIRTTVYVQGGWSSSSYRRMFVEQYEG